MYSDLSCRLCGKEDENQNHLLECEVLLKKCKNLYNDNSTKYEDLFAGMDAQLRIVKLFQEVLEIWDKLVLI